MNELEFINQRPEVSGRIKSGSPEARKRWFLDHCESVPREIEQFLAGTGIDFRGKRVVDLGCGDGSIALGVMNKFKPADLLGLELSPVDTEDLKTRAKEILGIDLPGGLRFGTCEPESIPVANAMSDLVMSWSVFEHVANPVVVMQEIHRILRPGGLMFLQIWPLYHSQRGSHLWNWYPDGWEHLQKSSNELRKEFIEKFDMDEALKKEMLVDYDSLNRITVDQIQKAILASGLVIRRVKLQSDVIDVPESLNHLSLNDLTTSGIKILAQRK